MSGNAGKLRGIHTTDRHLSLELVRAQLEATRRNGFHLSPGGVRVYIRKENSSPFRHQPLPAAETA